MRHQGLVYDLHMAVFKWMSSTSDDLHELNIKGIFSLGYADMMQTESLT